MIPGLDFWRLGTTDLERPRDSVCARILDLRGALIARHRESLTELRRDALARAWGGLSREAAINVLGDNATPAAIDALLDSARSQ